MSLHLVKTSHPSTSEFTAPDPLRQHLTVLDALEIGPVSLTKRRLTAPYKVVRDGQAQTFDLIYSYAEEVFDPADPASQNLAAMIAAQVALNYGLFCKRIVFNGPYDARDRQFLRKAMDNTSREIYVKKFLEPNPFLQGQATEMPVSKRSDYTQADLEFPQLSQGKGQSRATWNLDPNHYAILSSGGKDSLLSYGLIEELGFPVDPLFVNESGRHWYTAMNAFRHFKETIPQTAKVWTNSDRLFTWMLRQLPFVRPNFADMRADEYPIRLWTVAVFLFGVLPLMRKRGIGHLIIGDEYDTTSLANHGGIPHFNGLYDQSRYFDLAMTRYFQGKGWKVRQCSILRHLSELLIMKILVERYPHIQKYQTSCHATHIENGQALPCGRCEKCRRIVCMMTALGADPKVCGYKDSHIQPSIEGLARHGIHQESVEKRHLAYLLSRRIALPPSFGKRLKPTPVALKLRIHPKRAAITDMPETLRDALFRIFSQHGEGILIRMGRSWMPYDPFLADPGQLAALTSQEIFEPKPA